MPVSVSTFHTINPYSEEIISEYHFESNEALELKFEASHLQFLQYRKSTISSRLDALTSLISIIKEKKKEWSLLATLEMGKPLEEAQHEVEKCIGLCRYFLENTEDFLAPESIPYPQKAVVTKSAVGVVLGIMPWNYPFWQVFRFAIPAIMSGNTVLLKHAPNVTGCALAIQDAFQQSGFHEHTFQTLLADISQTHRFILDDRIQRISFTGSNKAGFSIAQAAGSVGKRCVLELGGSDPFIIMEDAPLEKVIPQAIKSRFINAGQSCISAKRFLIHSSIQEEFSEKLIEKVQLLIQGNPLDPATHVGPLARKDLKVKLLEQIDSAKASGSKILYQSNIPTHGYFVPITVFGNVTSESSVCKEEVFGPVATIQSFDHDEEMIKLANDTKFGLGASIWSENREKAFILAQHIDAGNVYVNEMMKSDFSLPFGGTKQSGFGKELSKTGMMEFMNLKTSIISTL